MKTLTHPLRLEAEQFRHLFDNLGPSLGVWRAAEIAALREQEYPSPVLDLGCGNGLIMSRVLPRVQIGLDPDRAAIEKAKDLGIYERFEAATIEQANLPNGVLGSIVSNSTLEHVEQIDMALEAIARALRPGGKLIFTTPTEAFPRWMALPLPGYVHWRNRHFIHLNLWPVEEWARRLKRVGLEVECVRPYMRKSWVYAWDWLDLAQMMRLGKFRFVGQVWRRLPPRVMHWLSCRAATWDLSSPPPGGGQLIAARKTGYT